jgi:hypothetical protein
MLTAALVMASSSAQISTNDWESKDRQEMGNYGTTAVLSHCLGYVPCSRRSTRFL